MAAVNREVFRCCERLCQLHRRRGSCRPCGIGTKSPFCASQRQTAGEGSGAAGLRPFRGLEFAACVWPEGSLAFRRVTGIRGRPRSVGVCLRNARARPSMLGRSGEQTAPRRGQPACACKMLPQDAAAWSESFALSKTWRARPPATLSSAAVTSNRAEADRTLEPKHVGRSGPLRGTRTDSWMTGEQIERRCCRCETVRRRSAGPAQQRARGTLTPSSPCPYTQHECNGVEIRGCLGREETTKQCLMASLSERSQASLCWCGRPRRCSRSSARNSCSCAWRCRRPEARGKASLCGAASARTADLSPRRRDGASKRRRARNAAALGRAATERDHEPRREDEESRGHGGFRCKWAVGGALRGEGA